MIKQMKFASIPVRDQDRAVAFYRDKLGFTVTTDAPMGEGQQRWIEMTIPGAETTIVLFTPEGQEDRIGTFSNIAFHTEEVEKTHADLIAQGVEFTTPPTKESWGTFAIFQDPDGNQFLIS